MSSLPRETAHIGAPPVKCQGIKTRLIPFIFSSIKWANSNGGRWIEPFVGSAVVVLNLAPERAHLFDTNHHIISLYQAIQRGTLNKASVREFLETEGSKLQALGEEYYYEVRRRFNEHASPLDFLFLNRSCFNGVMRFNRRGEFNVPFGHKPNRFTKSYITKIVNQVGWAARQMRDRDWTFRVGEWNQALMDAKADDFLYMDPPYIGRHTDYYNSWDEAEAERLALEAGKLNCGFAVSMWLENRHRRNHHIDQCWSGLEMRVCSHFYHVGSTESLRSEMDEALLIKPGFATPCTGKQRSKKEPAPDLQPLLALERQGNYSI